MNDAAPDLTEVTTALAGIRRTIGELNKRESELRQHRAELVRGLVRRHGWKVAAKVLGVGRSRVFAICADSTFCRRP